MLRSYNVRYRLRFRSRLNYIPIRVRQSALIQRLSAQRLGPNLIHLYVFVSCSEKRDTSYPYSALHMVEAKKSGLK